MQLYEKKKISLDGDHADVSSTTDVSMIRPSLVNTFTFGILALQLNLEKCLLYSSEGLENAIRTFSKEIEVRKNRCQLYPKVCSTRLNQVIAIAIKSLTNFSLK